MARGVGCGVFGMVWMRDCVVSVGIPGLIGVMGRVMVGFGGRGIKVWLVDLLWGRWCGCYL